MDTPDVVLLVEDEILIALLEQEALEARGYTVHTAASGEEALSAALSLPHIGIVLMDIDLGAGISGLEAAERILSEGDIPILFLSSYTDEATIRQAESISRWGYLTKGTSIQRRYSPNLLLIPTRLCGVVQLNR